MTSVTPYAQSDKTKKEQVAEMFDNISGRYDFLNHFLSMGIDKGWRRNAVNMLKPFAPVKVLDVATGTGDFAIEIAVNLQPKEVVGVDISEGMLRVGRQKVARAGLEQNLRLESGDSENLQFETDYFDAITVAFGVRNFENLERGLAEMYRVLKPASPLTIIEFSKPERFPFKQLYFFYFKNILPLLGRLVSKDHRAYTYLPESVEAFPYGDRFAEILRKTGFRQVKVKPLTFGIASIYLAVK
jgi:demethylmenaquinone methyltransferase/2-methoxy-6-polyprenyl-1,4-benzoquinol methylase